MINIYKTTCIYSDDKIIFSAIKNDIAEKALSMLFISDGF